MPVTCMDHAQQKTLMACYKTIQKMFTRYSQRPGMDWPAQEFVPLQLANTSRVGKKEAETGRQKKIASMTFGQPQGLAWFKSWKNSDRRGYWQFH
jgi:hypothetical protein